MYEVYSSVNPVVLFSTFLWFVMFRNTSYGLRSIELLTMQNATTQLSILLKPDGSILPCTQIFLPSNC